MMSLFSPFDYFFFWKSVFSFLFIFMIFSLCMGVVSSKLVLFFLVFSFLSSFFCSLKSKGMNKFSILLFVSIFFMLLLFNFFSVFSFIFPLSSQVSLVLFFSLGIWVSLVLFSIFSTPKKFLHHFVPEGAPLALVPLLFLIELVSNIIRPFTLMIRLVANILAGHLLMILLSTLVFHFFMSFPFYILLNAVESFVALIQAYIFSTMLVLYFSET